MVLKQIAPKLLVKLSQHLHVVSAALTCGKYTQKARARETKEVSASQDEYVLEVTDKLINKMQQERENRTYRRDQTDGMQD